MCLRKIEKYIAALLALLFAFAVQPADAWAEGSEENETESTMEYTLDGKTWDELIEEFYDSHNLQYGFTAFGYYNTVTGETHYYDENRWFIGASIYKLPLGMLYAEMLQNGEISLEDEVLGTKLETLLYGMIVNSSNIYADRLWKNRGSYQDMRRDFLKYFDEDEETVDPIYWRNNYFTAQEMLNCLKILYENPDTYAPIINLMRIASPDRNFKSQEQKFEIAHKYGYVPENGVSYYNDTAICYTDDPICLVMLTQGAPRPTATLAEFCTLACDYAQSSREQRLEAEAEEKKRLLAEEKAREEEAHRIAEQKAAEDERIAEEKHQEEEKIKAEEARIEAELQAEIQKRLKVIASSGVVLLCVTAVLLCAAAAKANKKKKR